MTGNMLDRAQASFVRALAARIRRGTIVLHDRAGTHRFGEGEPEVHVTVHQDAAYGKVLRGGSVALGDTYADGEWECDDPTALVTILWRNLAGLAAVTDRIGRASARTADWVRRRRPEDPERDRENIRRHYDLSNELFELMLDPTMMYSSAVFTRPGMTLEEASTAKVDRLCAKLGIGPGDHVVEIGTGWGGFAIRAASTTGCRVTTTTISEAQFEYATKRVADAGLTERVRVLDRDYRELEGTYDKLVSIEMIEAVDWRSHDTFFATCARLLAPEGLMGLQAITIDDRSYERAKNGRDFITETIFPGGCIPSIEAIARAVSRATPMRIVDLEDIGRHYAETLHRWHDSVDAHREAIARLGLGDRTGRLWDLYLSYCEAAFLERHISDVQVVLAMPGWEPPLMVRGC